MRNGAFVRRAIIPSLRAVYLYGARDLISTGPREMESGMSDSGSREGSVRSELALPASAPALSDIEAVAVAGAVLALAFAILT